MTFDAGGVARAHVPVLWRGKVLVDGVTRMPTFATAEPGSPPFVAFDPNVDGVAQARDAGLVRVADAARFVDPTFELGRYDGDSRALVVRALAAARWAERTTFCADCGRPLHWTERGDAKRCDNPSGSHRHFPRIDPAAIVLVEDGDRMLLGRQPGWPPGMYSTLAGFVEVGETVEEAVAREVFEESGVRVSDVRYFGSEPWPFPRSLMIGFFAVAATTKIERGDELEDVRWFDLAEGRRLQRFFAEHMPYGETIARRLIAAWLAARE